VGFVPAVAGHYIENTGSSDLLFLEMFKAPRFIDISLNNWIRRMPPQMATAHLNLDASTLSKIPSEKQEVIGR
jgi:oxalate decarboxylase